MPPSSATAPPQRHFLDWKRPALHSAAEFLLGLAPDGDLSSFLIVIPGGRASRLLLGRLLEITSARGASAPILLVPPRFCTPGELPDLLLPAATAPAPAGPFARQLAWAAALRSTPGDTIAHLIPYPPPAADLGAWWRLGAMLQQTHDQLSGELIRFADVPDLAERTHAAGPGAFPDAERWRAAAVVQEEYRRVLASRGLADPGLRIIEALAVAPTRLPATPPWERIILLGIPDLARGARKAIEAAGIRAAALVFAPESLADRFDQFGAINPEAWAEVTIDIPEPCFADGPADQARCALDAIASLAGRFAPCEITIGIPDEEVAPHIERCAEQAAAATMSARGRVATSLHLRSAMGTPVSQSPPLRILAAVRDLLNRPTFSALASLIRHPDVERYLVNALQETPARITAGRTTEWWLDVLDEYQAEHLPSSLPQRDDEWNTEHETQRALLSRITGAMSTLLGELLAAKDQQRPIYAWTAPLRELMSRLSAGIRLSPIDPTQRPTIDGNIAIRDAIMELERTAARPRAADAKADLFPACTAPEAIDLLLDIAGSGSIPEEGDENTIELLGWLELPLDPAPACIITGLNDGIVPSSTTGDSFLPDTLREALGLASNRRRSARDLFNLAALAATREVTLIAGRRSADNSPLAPSRLLFACDPERAVERIRRFTGDAPAEPRTPFALRTRPGEHNSFTDMPRIPAEPITSMPVTSFRTFLASPYLFYLQHVLRLREVGDEAVELDPLAYGNLLHDCLERFGNSDTCAATDAAKIEACLLDHLSTIAARRFGADPGVCIWLQLELARRRLREFAQLLAQRARDGWTIEHVEWRPSAGAAAFDVDGLPFGLRGKIDRIERHAPTGRWAVIDYKTGETAHPPERAHRTSAGWCDLQLPLYRHLATALDLPDDPDRLILGYITLPKKPGEVKLHEAAWSADDLREADETARAVVRRIRAGDFFELGDRPPEEGIFAALSGVGFIGGNRPVVPEEGPEGGDA